MSLVALRVLALLALILLLWNPASSRVLPTGDEPIVLVDASLSMTGAPWRGALDSARARARRRAIVWRFGTRVSMFDTTPPADGASRLAPALEAAASRAGEVIVLTDGALDDVDKIPPDLLRRPRVVLVPRPAFWDAYVAGVEGARHVLRGDTVRLKVSYGVAGARGKGLGTGGTIVVSAGNRRLLSQRVTLPDSGTISTELTFPVSRIPNSGWSVLEIRLDGAGDAEHRDDARLFALEVSSEPAAVILASPPDWESRFLAKAISDVARVPVKMFVETELGRWRDAATLTPVSTADLTRATTAARMIAIVGDPERTRSFTANAHGSRLVWATNGQSGDWYVEPPPSSPLTATLSGLVWDSLPPATAVTGAARDTAGAVVALTARLVRRGPARPIVLLTQRGGGEREAIVTAAGLWRWAFRGGAADQAYRTLIAGLVDWLLKEQGTPTRERAVPEALEVPNGLPVVWRWTSSDSSRPLAVTLGNGPTMRTDTLRFDAARRAELLLPPGMYQYALAGGPERGVVAVEEYSDEWRPRAPSIGSQPGEATARLASVGLRDRWWLFVIAMAALATEWALRRRQGLP